MDSIKRIAFFDSGVGGLSVLARIAQVAYALGRKDIEYLYLGDTARCPYGERSVQEINDFVREIVTWLDGHDPDHVVMACNTSCALARPSAEQVVRKGKQEILLDLIEPTAAYLLEMAQNNGESRDIHFGVGVMSTINTARSGAFGKALRKSPDVFKGQIKELGCPKLVPLIESGRLQDPDIASALDEALVEYLEQLAGTTHLVLGCTHYPFIKQQIMDLAKGRLRHLFVDGLSTVDPAVALAAKMTGRSYQEIEAIEARVDYTAPAFTICTTGDTTAFDRAASLCLSTSEIKSRHVALSQFAPRPTTNALAFPITLL